MSLGKKVAVLAHPQLAAALRRYFEFTRNRLSEEIQWVKFDEDPDLLIIEPCSINGISAKLISPYYSLQLVYSLWAKVLSQKPSAGIPPVILVAHDPPDNFMSMNSLSDGCGSTLLPGENLFHVIAQPFDLTDGFLPTFTELLKTQFPDNVAITEFNRLAHLLRKIKVASQPHHQPILDPTPPKPFFFSALPWNVLLIDNEIDNNEEGIAINTSLHRVISYPSGEFWLGLPLQVPGPPLKMTFKPYYPDKLLSRVNNIREFLEQLEFDIYRYDIDVILLDVALTAVLDGPIKHYGFYLIEDIHRQLFLLGRQNVPIIMFSKYEENEYVITSISRGAKWYASKRERELSSTIESLPGVIEKVFSPWLWRSEYEYKILSGCEGETVRPILRSFLHGEFGETSIAAEGFDLHDDFFGAPNQDSFNHVINACTFIDEPGESRIDIEKLAEFHYIFRRLFSSFDRVEVFKRANEGLSGTYVFFVKPFKRNLEYSVQMVKIGQYAEIERESQNFEEWINGMLDSFVGRIKAGPARAQLYSGLLYVAVGVKDDYKSDAPISLKKLIESSLNKRAVHGKTVEWEELKAFVSDIFNNVLACFYRTPLGEGKVNTNVASMYLEDLPSTIEGKLAAVKITPWQINDNDAPYPAKIVIARSDWHTGINFDTGVEVPVATELSALDVGQQLFVFPEYEVYEADREKYKLKLHNKYHQFRPLHGRLRNEEAIFSSILKQAGNETDLRVDIDIAPEDRQSFRSLFEDPRIESGKRLSVVLKEVRKLWEGDRLKFLSQVRINRLPEGKQVEAKQFIEACKGAMKNLDQSLHPWVTINGSPDFSYALLNAYGNWVEGKDIDRRDSLTLSNIHGDLNLENILVTGSGRRLLGWFIDFRRSRLGHTAFDFVKLETELKTHVLSECLARYVKKYVDWRPISESAAVAEALKWFHEFEQTQSITNRHAPAASGEVFFEEEWDAVSRVSELILLIRNLANNFGLSREYDWGLFLYSFTSLKFSNLDDPTDASMPPLPKCLSYISSCSAYDKLRTRYSGHQ